MGRPQLLQCGQFCAAPVVSKLAEMEARVLLPLGEGGPKGRMRVHFLPSPGASRHPLPKGEGHPETGLLLERTASRNLDKSGLSVRDKRKLNSKYCAFSLSA